MDLEAAEKAKLDNEWKRMGGVGRDLQRKRFIATMLAVVVATPFFAFGILVLLGSVFAVSVFAFAIGAAAIVAGCALGALVRKALWPKGQFA